MCSSITLKSKRQRKHSSANSKKERRRRTCCFLKPRNLASREYTIEKGSAEDDSNEGLCSRRLPHVDEKYVQDLPPKKISIMSKGALGHLISEVIEEETSSDAERERVL